MQPELRDILFLDIETVAVTENFQSLNERMKVQWSRKAAFLKREEQQTDEDLFNQRAGIYSEFGKIICIGIGMLFDHESGSIGLKTKSYYGDDEKRLLCEFKGVLEKLDSSTLKLCAHNGREFDFPYLCRRMLVNDISLPTVLNLSGRKSWEIPHLDTMEMWKFGDYKHYTSLDLLATIFNIPSSKNGIEGSQVNAVYYKEKDLIKIKDYCERDVVVLSQLFLKIKGHSLIPSQNIISA
jgi:3'-5' exonuclease